MTGYISQSEYDRLWAEARARGEYPPFIDPPVPLPDAEPETNHPSGVLAWLAELAGLSRPAPDPEIEAGP